MEARQTQWFCVVLMLTGLPLHMKSTILQLGFVVNIDVVFDSLLFSIFFQETESNILDAEPLVGKGVGAALFLASKKGNEPVT